MSFGSRYYTGDRCDQCGALIPWLSAKLHRQWHVDMQEWKDQTGVQIQFLKDVIDDLLQVGEALSGKDWTEQMIRYKEAWSRIDGDSERSAQ